MSNIQRDQYPFRGSVSEAKPQFAVPTIEQKGAQFISSTLTAGTDFTVPAGAAGTSVTIQLKFAPILGNNGRTAYFGNTTLVLGGALATTLTTEVAFISDADGKGGSVTSLTNGQYMVDYETGIIYGKRADTGTTGIATYSYWSSSSVSSGLSYNAVTNADQVQVINQLPRQTILLQRDVTVTSTAFDEYIDVEGLKTIGIQATFTSGTGTITLEGTLENNGTAPASCDFDDITQFGTVRKDAAAAANLTTGKAIWEINNCGYKWIKIKVASPSSFVGSLYANAIS